MRVFNEAQTEAINTISGPLMIPACPGSGKTTVVIARVKKMLESGINPYSIFVVTFTAAAAEEMKSRYEKECDVKGPVFSTIHSLCYQILQREWNCQIPVITAVEQWNFFKKAVDAKGNENDDLIKSVITEISSVRNNLIDLNDYKPESCSKEDFSKLFHAYAEYKHTNRKLDFDDILTETYSMFQNYQQILSKYQQIMQYLTVDEFQDVNYLQAGILYAIARNHRNICVVGDDDQSIYRFRGAKPEIMLAFEQAFPGCKRIDMGTNYRSGRLIVEQAGNLICHNKKRFDKEFTAFKEETGEIELVKKTEEDSAGDLVQRIEALREKGIPYSEMAVLYRTNAENIEPILAMMQKGIPYCCAEGIRALTKHFIFQDIRSYYRISHGKSRNGREFFRCSMKPSRYIYKAAFDEIKEDAKDLREIEKQVKGYGQKIKDKGKWRFFQNKISDFFGDLEMLGEQEVPTRFLKTFMAICYNDYLLDYKKEHKAEAGLIDMIMHTFKKSMEGFQTMEEWFQAIELIDNNMKNGNRKKGEDAVVLSTLHGSKGLEWDYVFIAKVIKENIPYVHKGETLKPEDIEEERRLFYVGITRARKKLTLYTMMGAESSFLKEMTQGKKELKQKERNENRSTEKKIEQIDKRNVKETGIPYKEGQIVCSVKYGLGEIMNVDEKTIEVAYYDLKGECTKYSTKMALKIKPFEIIHDVEED